MLGPVTYPQALADQLKHVQYCQQLFCSLSTCVYHVTLVQECLSCHSEITLLMHVVQGYGVLAGSCVRSVPQIMRMNKNCRCSIISCQYFPAQ